MSSSQIKELFSRLTPLGITPKFARCALPSWWDDSIASSEAGLQQAQLYLSKVFNLDIMSFEADKIKFRQTQRKFKLSRNVTEDSVNQSAHYVTGIARMILGAIDEQGSVPSKSSDLRSSCLVSERGVDLEALLMWCASANIPVIHVDVLPGKKMTGLVVRESDKFAIVLSKKGCQSEMLFWLAHELGHIACNHLNQDGFFADERIGEDLEDDDERQADFYGVHLLNGSDTKYTIKRLVRASELALAAARYGKDVNVDAGHIILNFGHNNKSYIPLARGALRELGQSSEIASKTVNKVFFGWFPSENISEDQFELIRAACSFE